MRTPKTVTFELNENGCHVCTSHYLSPKGYPIIHIKGESRNMCRYVFKKTYGNIPEGLWVLHHCDNPSCINPDHLFLGTNTDNVNDKVQKNRQSRLRGEKHPMVKLTEKQVTEIRKNQNLTCRQMAKIYGVHFSTIAYIKSGKLWKNLRGEMLDGVRA